MTATRLGSSEAAPVAWVASRRRDIAIASVAVAAYVVGYLAFFPRMYSTDDDSSYLAQAYALRHGHVTLDSLHESFVETFTSGHHLVSQYPPGIPALLAAVSFIGWTPALAINLVIALATCAVVAVLLKRLGVPPLFALLYLLYPTVVLFSQTVMADLCSGLLVAAAMVALLDERPLLVGLLLGLAVLVRDANVLACATIPAGVVFDLRRRPPAGGWVRGAALWLAKFAVGVVPGAVISGVVYYAVDGGQAYGGTAVGSPGEFAFRFLPEHLPWLIGGALLMYPLMLFAPLTHASRIRTPLVLTCYGFVVLYGAWYFESKGSTWAQTLVVSQRFLLVVLPLFVVSYAGTLWALARRWRWVWVRDRARAGLAVVTAGVLAVVAVLILRTNHQHTVTLADARAGLLKEVRPGDLLVCDQEVGKLFLPQWGARQVYIVGTQPVNGAVGYIRNWAALPSSAGHQVFVADWPDGGLQGSAATFASAVSVVASGFHTTLVADAPLGLPAGVDLRTVSVPSD